MLEVGRAGGNLLTHIILFTSRSDVALHGIQCYVLVARITANTPFDAKGFCSKYRPLGFLSSTAHSVSYFSP